MHKKARKCYNGAYGYKVKNFSICLSRYSVKICNICDKYCCICNSHFKDEDKNVDDFSKEKQSNGPKESAPKVDKNLGAELNNTPEITNYENYIETMSKWDCKPNFSSSSKNNILKVRPNNQSDVNLNNNCPETKENSTSQKCNLDDTKKYQSTEKSSSTLSENSSKTKNIKKEFKTSLEHLDESIQVAKNLLKRMSYLEKKIEEM